VPSKAFMLSQPHRPVVVARTTTLVGSLICKETDEELIHDIEVMEDEAKHRLQNLMEQMDELQAYQATITPSVNQQVESKQDSLAVNAATRTEPNQRMVTNVRRSVTEKVTEKKKQSASLPNKKAEQHSQKPAQRQQQPQDQKEVEIIRSRPLDLLADTSWKIVLNIGREEGTWMPSHWGKSGSRLRVEVHCTFLNQEVENSSDPFFAHATEPVRYILIEEAFAWPTMVGVGRRQLDIAPRAGRYQICPGAGPAGTDLLRLMIPIPEDLKKDDVTLKAGRVYGTTGYFGHPDEGRQQIINAVQEEYDHCLAKCVKLQQELAKSEHFLSWCRSRQAVWNAESELDHAMERLTLAGQHYPDHAHMRTDPSGRVGLAKEGGLCIQVHTGLAMEYHILGRMEVGHLKR
jgi:hypothetical protein